VGLLALIAVSTKIGAGGLFTEAAMQTRNMAAADAAVALTPTNADAHLARGTLLEEAEDLPSAVIEYQQAASLRPTDYVLWLNLARVEEMNEARDQAIQAARRAVQLAPHYAQPHWQLGNILLRAGETDEGLSELALAAATDGRFLPAVIGLSWQLLNGNAKLVMKAVNPETPESFRMLGLFFSRHREIDAAMQMFRSAGNDGETIDARKQFVNDLLAQKRFRDAYVMWAINKAGRADDPTDLILNPGFEDPIDLEERGFGWCAKNYHESISLLVDGSVRAAGQNSLRVQFNGASEVGTPIISQLLVIRPKTAYQLHFAYRTEDLVSGGLPRITVIDARENKACGESAVFAPTTDGWQRVTIDFVSGEPEAAVEIVLRREPCSRSPCPIFGRLWLDDFSLSKR
jgi:tetratricopeptide (TPR) repeat protein